MDGEAVAVRHEAVLVPVGEERPPCRPTDPVPLRLESLGERLYIVNSIHVGPPLPNRVDPLRHDGRRHIAPNFRDRGFHRLVKVIGVHVYVFLLRESEAVPASADLVSPVHHELLRACNLFDVTSEGLCPAHKGFFFYLELVARLPREDRRLVAELDPRARVGVVQEL